MAQETKRIEELEAMLAKSEAENVALRQGVRDAVKWASIQMSIETNGVVLTSGLCGKLSNLLEA